MGHHGPDGHHGSDDHHGIDADPADVRCAVLTVSSSRDPGTDASGDAVEAVLSDAGHPVVARDLVADDLDAVRKAVEALADEADAVVTTGGSGPAPGDVTPEAVRPLLVKELPGFGERFRRVSEADVGAAAALSRALAGVVRAADGRHVALFCLPGSPDGARAGAALVVEGLGHLVGLLRASDGTE